MVWIWLAEPCITGAAPHCSPSTHWWPYQWKSKVTMTLRQRKNSLPAQRFLSSPFWQWAEKQSNFGEEQEISLQIVCINLLDVVMRHCTNTDRRFDKEPAVVPPSELTLNLWTRGRYVCTRVKYGQSLRSWAIQTELFFCSLKAKIICIKNCL